MSQSFRQPPRQIGFKPQTQRLSSRPLPQHAADPADAAITRQSQHLQQLHVQIRQHEDRLKHTLSPPTRSILNQKLQQLKHSVQQQQHCLRELRGQARIRRLTPLLQTFENPCESAETLSQQLRQQGAELEAIYRVHQPLPTAGQQELGAWLGPVQQLIAHLQQGQNAEQALSQATQALEVLRVKLWPPEAEVLQSLWQSWLRQIQRHWPAPLPVAETDDDFELLSFESFDHQEGELEVSFDFSQRRSVVRNQWGITLNQPKKTYQEYLDQGFDSIDQSVGSQFQQREPLHQAVEAFLEAISLDKSRYEAYFGLGYLYSLVQDLDHALYFLEISWKISGQPRIQELIQQLQPQRELATTH